ncbi:FxsA family protein [Sulfobacillus thermosulfidooxidans]|uniref:FxsA family protein n=1 Tax=Sulfobacillus thermosulfidooxidans TaxID=28034 RepID=UPI000410C8F9|nr:FxsA family protein [Sulfobacillus thermosulfidooxidans]OLZ11792.1 hypothetical protein BFX05_07340 [Sulfobacillus thermosulfidooxidans]OLZ17070.1 hypothetical protein BFX06_14135 [Sulfobacillus thermosulfidooxidans]OLZ20166.1 hypothetical protein BFX07_00865 [Sulfobacillus thermosulfidooxidans]
MLKRLLALFLVVPLVELFLLFLIAHYLGWGWTIGITLVSSLLGAYLAKISGKQWWETVKREWASEGFPVHRLGEGALLLISMAFMITPGPLTGVIGLLFMIPKVRLGAARLIARWVSNRFLERLWR